jgi:dTMP kinase
LAGIFISFEGIDGVGKSTQADLLEAHLRSKGREVVRTFEPGGTELGKEIRNLLLHQGHVDARAEALLYAADRAHHTSTKIRPALEAGTDVITDRYLDSSVAYQGAGRVLGAQEVRDLSVWATNGLLPALTVLLDLDAAAAAQRRSKTGEAPDRLEREKLDFFEATRAQYLSLAQAEPERFLVLDATASVDQLQAQIRSRIDQLLGA